MNIGEEIFENINKINKQRLETIDNLLDSNLEVMKAVVHNKVLLMVILSKLGFEDSEIDKLNQDIYDSLEQNIKDFKNKKDIKEEIRTN